MAAHQSITLRNGEEIWKDVDGYEGVYEVSSYGRVRSLDRVIDHPRGKTRRRGKVIKQFLTTWGYLTVHLMNNKVFCVHKMVLTAFIPNPKNKKMGNHKNGDKSDNRLSNLEWASPQENIKHAYNTGLNISRKGVKYNKVKLTEY